jgi:hypothetical protein
VPERELYAKCAFPRGGRSQDGENRWAQRLHPEENERDDNPQQDYQAKLLRTGRERHRIT